MKPWADTHKAWAIFLALVVLDLFSFRYEFWLTLAVGLLGTLGAYYGYRGLVRGPLRILGGLFMLLNGLAAAGAIARLIHSHFGK